MTIYQPILKGLVLAGGKSIRMGQDKGLMRWHEKEQRYHLADLLSGFCSEVFISCREEQTLLTDDGYSFLPDKYSNIGPLGGMLSAFDLDSQCAWLVVACDMILLDTSTLQNLVQHREPLSFATAYKNVNDGLPEPLATIWEPQAYPLLQAVLTTGGGPRKVLVNNTINLIDAVNADALLNVNTLEDLEKIKVLLTSFTP